MRRALATLALVAAAAAGCGAGEPAAPVALERAGEPTTTTTTRTPSTPAAPTTTITLESSLPARPPLPADTPAGLAGQIHTAERALRDRATAAAARAHMAVLQQVAYRRLALRPAWDRPVLALLPRSLHAHVERHIGARRQLRAMHRTLADTLPAWRIVDPPAADALLRHYREAEATFDIAWRYLAAINLVETGMGRIRGTSVAGAQGPMQFMPATWAAFGAGGDIDDPRDAILAAGRYLAHNHGATDIAGALWNYNHSDRYVRAVMAYADIMRDEPSAFRAFHQWGIFYLTTAGDFWLPIGYEQIERVPVAAHRRTGAVKTPS